MPRASETVNLAFRLAAEEAIRAGQPQIEPPHLFLGICCVERVPREDAWQRYGVVPNTRPLIQQEWTEASTLLTAAGLDPVALRREIRSCLPQNSIALPSNHVANRSDATRAIFDNADQRAEQAKRKITTLPDLLASLIPVLLEKNSPLPAHLAEPLRKLEKSLEPPPVAGVTLLLDAARPAAGSATQQMKASRLEALFYDFPLQMASQPNFQALLDCVVSSLLKFFPTADRAALLLRERGCTKLVLQAHVPCGEPSASMELAEHILENNTALIWNPPADAVSNIGARTMVELRSTSGMYAALSWQNERIGVLCVDTKRAASSFNAEQLRTFIAIAHHVALSLYSHRVTQDLQTQNQLLQRLLTHFSPKVRQRLLDRASRGRLTLGGERSEVSILFSDIRGFTLTSASMEPDDVVDMLNDYFAALVDAIFHNEGTVDKFIGDAILAVFGSPDPDPKHHEQALHAAIAMQEAVQKLNAARKARNQPVSEIGIGIHSGEVLHGFVGTPDRLEFTVVGDAVNRASRFCSAAGANEILLSQDFYKHVWREIEVESRQVATKHEGNWPAYHVLRPKKHH